MAGEEQESSNAEFQFVRGIPFPNSSIFNRKNVEDAMDYMPKDRDVIIASYPKTGTTWLQYIVLQITSNATLFPTFDDVSFKLCPYIEMTGVEAVEALTGDRIYKHHLPYDVVKKNSETKTIYIYRNPEDTIISYYHFYSQLGFGTCSDVNKFFNDFAEGKTAYGSYFDHVSSFYKHREDKNILMISYEKLYSDRRTEILRIAEFLGDQYKNLLLEDEEMLDKIIEHTSFDYMKKNLYLSHPDPSQKRRVNFFRKGIVGDGKSALTNEQRDVLKLAAKKVLEGTTVFEEWYPEEKTSQMAGKEQERSNAQLQLIRGIPFPIGSIFNRKSVEDAMDYMPKDRDVIVASYPKTGTTWMQYIVLQITSKATLFPTFDDVLFKVCPFIDMTGVEAVEALIGDRIYKHHLPYDMIKRNDKAKTIYMYRHPEDTIISFFHFYSKIGFGYYSDVNVFFNDFVEGNITYGSYFEHVLSSYKHREEKNILLVSYEKLYADRRTEILRVAEFLGDEYKNILLEDERMLDQIIEHTRFDYMQKNLYLTHPDPSQKRRVNFFRKGTVGDGKSALTNEQRDVLKLAAKKVLEGTTIFEEWYPEEK